jgi:hypothetical protein
MTSEARGLPLDTPRTDLALSAIWEVPHRPDRTPTDPHQACRDTVLPVDRRHGDFWSKVLKTDCCWLWTRSRSGQLGYGAYWQNGGIVRAHRVAYELEVGPIPEGLHILHECDVPWCVRPDHLRPGTRVDNQRDMVAKHRNAPQDGEHNHHAKFTWDQVHVIRNRKGETRRRLALEFGTTPKYIQKIIRERVWPESSCPVHGTQAVA